jgi:hypothetical protein
VSEPVVTNRKRLREGPWIALSLVAGVVFLANLGHLWPLARLDLSEPSDRVVAEGRAALESLGFDVTGYSSAEWLRVDSPALNYAERTFGRETTQSWIGEGLPLYEYRVGFKRRGSATTMTVVLHPARGLLGWSVSVEDDEPGPRLAVDRARQLALDAIEGPLALDAKGIEERSVSSESLDDRTDHRFVYERKIREQPELTERIGVVVAGDRVVSARRALIVPPAARRAAREAEAPGVALETVGVALLALAALGAFFVFLRHLRDGTARLGRALIWPAVVLVCMTAAATTDSSRLFRAWDPLWPVAISALRSFVFDGIGQIWILLVLLAVVAAGDALDRAGGSGRGTSLWLLARGRLLDPSVGRASGRGFLIGLICGGVMALAVLALERVAGATTALQPRGFFFYPLNSDVPALTSLTFFWGVAMAEELGYRFFGGTWLLRLTRRGWVAIVVPAVVYGLTHTRLDFLPPAEPFWGRALVLTLVGCVWGWAFLRFDALTVVLSHFTADLFIFSWPRLASGETIQIAAAVATICVPLLPALLWPLRRRAPAG